MKPAIKKMLKFMYAKSATRAELIIGVNTGLLVGAGHLDIAVFLLALGVLGNSICVGCMKILEASE